MGSHYQVSVLLLLDRKCSIIYRVKKEGYGQIPQNVLSGSGKECYFGQQWLDLNVKKNYIASLWKLKK
jgi:hypothetical protein